jgi:hypothetical protein
MNTEDLYDCLRAVLRDTALIVHARRRPAFHRFSDNMIVDLDAVEAVAASSEPMVAGILYTRGGHQIAITPDDSRAIVAALREHIT